MRNIKVNICQTFFLSGESVLRIDHSVMQFACFIVSTKSYEEVEQNAVNVENKIKDLTKLDKNAD